MSDIGGPSRPEFVPTEASTRVTRGGNATDHGSAENQKGAKSPNLKKNPPAAEKPHYHDPAVTISASLSKLEEDVKFNAEIKGHDIDKRPIITSKHGTYIMQGSGKNEKILQELAAGEKAELRVTNLDKEIKAQLIIRRDKAAAEKLDRPQFEAITVTLILTSLGEEDGNERISARNSISLSQIANKYPSSAVFQAEAAARQTTSALNDKLPLPAAGSKYTLFEKTLLDEHAPSPHNSLHTQNLNPLLFQEVIPERIKAPDTIATTAIAEGGKSTAEIRKVFSSAPVSHAQINQLLHDPAALTLIRNFKNPHVTLPHNIPETLKTNILKAIGQSEPLNIFTPNVKNNISIISIAIPETGTTPEAIKNSIAVPINALQKNIAAQNPENKTHATALKGKNISHISAIVIDPKASLIQKMAAEHLGQTPVKIIPQKIDNTHIFLATPTSVIKIKTTAALPVGTIVHFTVPISSQESETTSSDKAQAINPAHPAKSTPGLIPLPPEVANISDLVDDWSSLSHLISSLNSSHFGAMANMISSKIPNMASPVQMTTGIVFFMAAIGRSFGKNSKPAEIWLGKSLSTELKKNGHEALLSRLNSEMVRISDLAGGDGQLREWRPALLPFSNGSEIQAVPFFIKKQQDEQNEGKPEDQNSDDEKNTRFMIELNLSKMGNILIDGMLTQKRLEIIIKSSIKLDSNFRKRIIQKYDLALDKYNFSGNLSIHDEQRGSISLKNMIIQAEASSLNPSPNTSISTIT